MNQPHDNPCGLRGVAFVEFASPTPGELDELFHSLGFIRHARYRSAPIDLYSQGEIHFVLHRELEGHAAQAVSSHGATICGVGLEVDDARSAHTAAVERGASSRVGAGGLDLPAVQGIGDSLLYFVESPHRWFEREFNDHPTPRRAKSRGLSRVDHLTHNVEIGELDNAVAFYESVFGFRTVRRFDIRGRSTGLRSIALRSPDGSFSIPINQATEQTSQIAEYLREHRGPGIQHLALLTDDLLGALDDLRGGPIRFLDAEPGYYERIRERVPNIREELRRLAEHQVLADGDKQGYLLQIFTRNLIGPMFFELIQRENHLSFGEGNFRSLFRSIEREQEGRGEL